MFCKLEHKIAESKPPAGHQPIRFRRQERKRRPAELLQYRTKIRFSMSYQDDFNTWRDRIEAVPPEAVKLPTQPVDDYTAAAETLAVEANKDRAALGAAGLDVTLIDELPSLSGALRFCQAVWMSEYRAREEAQKEWLEQSPQAYSLRDDMLHHFTFAYRKDSNIRDKVMRIREGNSNADMVQDLAEFALLGEKYPEPLRAINFDMDLLEQSLTVSQHMAELLAASNGATDDSSVNKKMRDKAFTLLFEKESTIREYGRYVFWKDEDRRSKYYKQ